MTCAGREAPEGGRKQPAQRFAPSNKETNEHMHKPEGRTADEKKNRRVLTFLAVAN